MAELSRSANSGRLSNPGPYLAKVISHADPSYMGNLQVELLKSTAAGNTPEALGETVTVRYLNPFYGVTPLSANTSNPGFYDSQQSYGMWFVPPDVGQKVMCIFVEGDLGQGYWMGCVMDEFVNYMVPGAQPGSYDNESKTYAPVGEYNKKVEQPVRSNATRYVKPINTDFYQRLSRAGLQIDEVRGLSSSTARREVPSAVFGVSTPGPINKNGPKSKVGTSDAKATKYTSRLGGSSFVMDDGDERLVRKGPAKTTPFEYANVTANETGDKSLPANECVRIRTRTGHQILFHNTEDLIYISHGSGDSWIELTANGKIDIFANDSISIRTSVDLNISADRDINMSAARDINFNSGRDHKHTVGNNWDTKVGVDAHFDIGANYDHYVGADQKVLVGGTGDLIVTGAHKITSQATLDINTTGARTELNAATLDINTVGDRKDTQANWDINTGGYNYFTSGGNAEIRAANTTISGGDINLNGPEATEAAVAGEAAAAASATTAANAPFPQRVPTHEPWGEHEHLNPESFGPDATQGVESPSAQLNESTPLITSESDERPTTTQFRDQANVSGPQEIVFGQVGPAGEQPSNPVPVNDLQQYFVSELINAIGLDPATALNSANPDLVPEGETPGNAEALGMAMAQVQAECTFIPKSENLNYSARRLRQVFPSRVKTDEFARQLSAAGPAAIGNTLYGGRYGNARDEGYKYRGRGLIQLTFKSNYETYSSLAGVPQVVDNPDLANDPEIATKLACAYIKSKSITWTSFDYAALGQEFRRAVGYADQGGAETNRRIGLGRGFANRLINKELVPLASLTLEAQTTDPRSTGDVPKLGPR